MLVLPKIEAARADHHLDDFSPAESKRRLRELARQRMDADRDGQVTLPELAEYVRRSLMTLDAEETRERFDEIDRGFSSF